MGGNRFKDLIIVPSGTSMTDLVKPEDYSYSTGAILNRPLLKAPLNFFAQLVVLGEYLRADDAYRRLVARENNWKPANSWHHMAFGQKYPEAQDQQNPDPYVSVGQFLKVSEFDRVLATYWDAQCGRKLYLNFASALIGPNVRFLVVHELSDA